MKKVKVAVIGVGHLGTLHSKMFCQIKECELVGVYDIDLEKAKAKAAEFKTKQFWSLEEVFDNCDAVSVVATTSAHYEICKKAFEAKKDVFVEKPITANISEAEELISLAEKNNLIFQVGHIERFNPAVMSLSNYKIEPMFIQSDRLSQFNPRGTDVAVVLDLMIHDIDLILSFVKSEPVDIRASGVAVVSDYIDIANARIEFENGCVANVTASRISQKKMRKMRIFQKDAYIAIDFNAGVSEVFRLVKPEIVLSDPFVSFGEIGIGDKKRMVIYEQPEIKEINALKYELEMFIKSCLDRTPPIVSGSDGLKALKVANMIVAKIEESLKKANLN